MVEIVDVCNISSNYDFIVFKICVKSEQTKLTLKNMFLFTLKYLPLILVCSFD